MGLEKIITPYEILVRFDENGKLQGSHAGYLTTVLDDGKVLNRSTELKQLDLAEQEGFPFSEIMDSLTLDALIMVDNLKLKLLEANANNNKLNEILNSKHSELVHLKSKLSEVDADNNQLNESLNSKYLELGQLTSKLSEADAEIKKMIGSLSLKDLDLGKMESNNQSLIIENEKMIGLLDAKDLEISQLKEALTSLKSEQEIEK